MGGAGPTHPPCGLSDHESLRQSTAAEKNSAAGQSGRVARVVYVEESIRVSLLSAPILITSHSGGGSFKKFERNGGREEKR